MSKKYAGTTASYRSKCYVDIYYKPDDDSPPEWVKVSPIDGSVNIDRTADNRRTFDATFAEYPEIFDSHRVELSIEQLIPDPYAIFMRPFMLHSTDVTYDTWEPLGIFKVYNMDTSLPEGSVKVSGFDLSKTVQEFQFLSPYSRKRGKSVYELITKLVHSVFTVSDYDWDSYPGGKLPEVIFHVPDKTTKTLVVEEKDRWALIKRLCEYLGGVPFFDRWGRFVVTPIDVNDKKQRILEGRTIGVSRSTSRDGVWNAVVVTGENPAKKGKKKSGGKRKTPSKAAARRSKPGKSTTPLTTVNMRNAKSYKTYASDGTNHYATDIGASKGSPIFAVRDGVVKFVRDSEPNCFTCPSGTPANCVVIESEYNGRTCIISYNHHTPGSARVQPGDRVVAGQVIARVGSSGYSRGYHLHIGAHWGSYTGPGDQWEHRNNPSKAIYPPTVLWRKSGQAQQTSVLDEGSYAEPEDFNSIITDLTQGDPGQMHEIPNNAKPIWAFLINLGATRQGAAGVLGNFYWESRLDPAAIENNGSGEGHGLAQWSYGRKTSLFAFANRQGKSWKNLDLQLQFMKSELEGSYRSTLRMLKTVTSARDAAYQFHKLYEGSGDSEAQIKHNRMASAVHFLDHFKNADGDDRPARGVTNDQIIERAKSWLRVPVPYNQGAWWKNQYGTYRQDCSGFVSMCWKLKTSRTTVTLPGVSHKIQKSELQTGDILLNTLPGSSGHVVIFDKWANNAHDRYWGYEQTPGHTKHRIIPYPYWRGNYEPYRRNVRPQPVDPQMEYDDDDDEDTPAPRGVAKLKRTPTAWDGPFGKVPVFVNNAQLHSDAECEAFAKLLLARAPDLGVEYSITSLPDPTLEPGTFVRFVAPREEDPVLAVVDTVSLPFGGTNAMNLTIRATEIENLEEGVATASSLHELGSEDEEFIEPKPVQTRTEPVIQPGPDQMPSATPLVTSGGIVYTASGRPSRWFWGRAPDFDQQDPAPVPGDDFVDQNTYDVYGYENPTNLTPGAP